MKSYARESLISYVTEFVFLLQASIESKKYLFFYQEHTSLVHVFSCCFKHVKVQKHIENII